MPPGRDTYRHGDLRRAALTVSTDLIESGGPAHLSLREVARQVGVSHGAIYHHFPDKAALLRAIAENGFVDLRDAMRARMASHEDPLDKLYASGIGYVGFALDHPGVFRMMFRPDLTGIRADDAPPTVAGSWELLRTTVEQCQDAGHASAAPTDLLAMLCWTTVHGLATLLLDQPLRPPASAVAETGEPETLALASAVVRLLNQLIAP